MKAIGWFAICSFCGLLRTVLDLRAPRSIVALPVIGVALGCALVLTACGGGGGGGGSTSGGFAALGPIPAAVSPSAPEPAKPECSVTLYGDSVLRAPNLAEAPAAAIRRLRPAYRVVDRSEPGDYVLRKQAAFLGASFDTRAVVVQFGLNDAGNGFDYREPLRSMLQRAKALKLATVVTGISRTRAPLPARDDYDAIARQVAADVGATFADWGAAVYADADMADDVHPAQAYSDRLVLRLVAALDVLAPECRL